MGACLWIINRIDAAERRILEDFNAKHESNAVTIKALGELVLRHDVLLNAEFGAAVANGRNGHLRK